MAVLNEGLTFADVPANDRRAFLGHGVPRQFPVGWTFYKFTDRPLVGSGGGITPWWSSVRKLNSMDLGLDGTLERAQRLDVDPRRFARVRSSVTKDWNSMDQLVCVRLTRAAWGIVGRCASQQVDLGLPPNIVFIGGAWQVYLPQLSSGDLRQVPPPRLRP
jgi:hypothetical protein